MQKALKYTLGFLFISLISIGQNKSPINWLTVAEADSLYKIEKKPIFIDVYTSWCGWCKVMDRGRKGYPATFKDPNVAAYLNKNFYAIKFNAESQEPVVFNNKTYSNSQGVRAAKMLADLQNEVDSLQNLSDSLRNDNKKLESGSWQKKQNSLNILSIEIDLPQKKTNLNNFKRRARKTTHDFAINLCNGQMSYPTFIILFNDLKSNMPIKGYKRPNDLIGFLAFINEGIYRSTRDANGFTHYFKQSVRPDSLQAPNVVKWEKIEDAITNSKKDGKKILVHIIHPQSIASNITDKVTLRTPSTAKIMNDNFHCVTLSIYEAREIMYKGKVLKNVGGVHQLPQALLQNQFTFPTISFLDTSGNLIMKVPQYFEPGKIDPVFQYFIEEGYKTGTFAEWKKAKEIPKKEGK